MAGNHRFQVLLLLFISADYFQVSATKFNSLTSVTVCENQAAKMNCNNKELVLNVIEVIFIKENANVCGNNVTAPECEATKQEEDYLKCALRKACNGKTRCDVHVAHGIYRDMNLPCRNHGIKIRVEIIFDCFPFGVKEPERTDCETSPKARLPPVTSNLVPTRRSTISAERQVKNTGPQLKTWRRKRPITCNSTKEPYSHLM
ncbi:uncharacterized protein [Montipora capricornis]|uniref:uncharacterized protein n=1 Tax=Montipora capricornis TaxID=246305 RepID=UPI0035F17061